MFYAGDTQDDRIYYIIGAIDRNANVYILKANHETLLENIRAEIGNIFFGRKLIAGVQDKGAHRTLES